LQEKKETPNFVELRDETKENPNFVELRHETQNDLTFNSEGLNNDDKDLGYIPNPEVVEIFKDFPDFYREKAIERYSKRQGWLRLDPVWYYYMSEEKNAALQGRYLEDERTKEMVKNQQAEKYYEDKAKEYKIQKENNPNMLQERVKTTFGIPHQEGESFEGKMFELALMAFCGVTMAHNGFTYAERYPYKPKWYGTVRRISGLFGCLCFSVVGVYYRFFDMGYWDLSYDKRSLLARVEEDMETTIPDKVLDLLGNENGYKDTTKPKS